MAAIDRIRRIWVAGSVIPLMLLVPQGASDLADMHDPGSGSRPRTS